MSETINFEELGKMLEEINERHERMLCKDCAWYNIYICRCRLKNIIIGFDAVGCIDAVRRHWYLE